MNDETLRVLTAARLHERLLEAQRERLARRLRHPAERREGTGTTAAMLGHLLTVRRQAAQ